MCFLIDMNLSPAVATWLRAQGHDAVYAGQQGLASSPDTSLFALAASEKRIVVTFDLDFGEILAASGGRQVSVLLLRLRGMRQGKVIERLAAALAAAGSALNDGAIVSIEESRLRVRRLPIEPSP